VAVAGSLEAKGDPYAIRTGAMRRAYRSPVDGQLSEFGLYVPYDFDATKKYPLIVGLHGMNGNPMSMMRWLFGYDDAGRDAAWEDRHPIDRLPTLEAIVVTPDGHWNAMYRDMGEDDVMRVVDWALANLPVDPTRVTITGPSMGGIGSAAIPFHHPDRFAAAAPLCGYHSYFIRRDVAGRPLRPWERFLADERSNVSWAFNGLRIPLWIVHGTKDLPEENSGVLIDRYKALGYGIKHDHPDLGHNVWQKTYENLKGASWLMWHRRDEHPVEVRFRTMRSRFADDAWVHLDELATPDTWAQVVARIRKDNVIDVLEAKGLSALHFDRDGKRIDASAPVTVAIDGAKLTFAPSDALTLHRDVNGWHGGPAPHAAVYKHGAVTGPIRDVFHEPVLFVYGADDPAQARANEEVARAWANVRWGVRVKFPVISDAEFFARGEPLANDRALFLVGNAKSNRVVRELEPSLPIKVDGDAIVLPKDRRFTGQQLGAAFIHPNPKRTDRYVVVVEGVDALGTWRSLSLPDIVPDFVVYDDRVAPSRGQMVLGAGSALAAGFFTNDWLFPSDVSDPVARLDRPGPKSEHDATPYLP
jgi:poly(3-hydroxybutyrate) depolymerase